MANATFISNYEVKYCLLLNHEYELSCLLKPVENAQIRD